MKTIFALLLFVAPLFAAGPAISNYTIDNVTKTSARVSLNIDTTGAPTGTLGAPLDGSSGSITFATGWQSFPYHGIVLVDSQKINYQNRNGNTATIANLYWEYTPSASHTTGTAVTMIAGDIRSCFREQGTSTWSDEYSSTTIGNRNNYATRFLYTYLTGLKAGTTYEVKTIVRYRADTMTPTAASGTGSAVTVTLPRGHGRVVGDRVYVGGITGLSDGFQTITAIPSDASFTFASNLSSPVVGSGSYVTAMGTIGCNATSSDATIDTSKTFTTQPLADPSVKLPQKQVDTTMPTSYNGGTFTVSSSNCNDGTTGLQALINSTAATTNSANLNFQILIPRGLTCNGAYYTRRKKKADGSNDDGTGTGWTVIRTDAPDTLLPPPGTQATKAYADNGTFPRIQNTGGSDQSITLYADDTASGYRFLGLDLGFDINTDSTSFREYNAVIHIMGTANGFDLEGTHQPYRHVFDRCLIGGSWYNTQGTRTAIRMRGSGHAVIDSHLHNCNAYPNMDVGCFQITDGEGPFLLQNSTIEGGSETVFVDDNPSYAVENGVATDKYVASDITIRGNTIRKPYSYFDRGTDFQKQTVLPITSATQYASEIALSTSIPNDIGDATGHGGAAFPNPPGSVVIAGASGILAALNGSYPPQARDSKYTFRLKYAAPVTVALGGTLQLTSGVLGTATQTVNWAVLSGPGSVNSSGLYTAPSTGGNQYAVVTATPTADTSKKAGILVVIAPSTQIQVSPKRPAILHSTGTQQFTVGQTATWTVEAGDGLGSTGLGLVDSTGLYTPAAVSQRRLVIVKATASGSTDASLITVDPATSFRRIAVGQYSTYQDSIGQVWEADNGYDSGGVGSTGTAIANTDEDPLFQAERYGGTGSPKTITYTLTGLANGTYTVILGFFEGYLTDAPGSGTGRDPLIRNFDILLQGSTAESGFNIYTAAGATFTAVRKAYTATVSSGTLTIALRQVVGAVEVPKLDNIEVLAGSSEPIRPYVGSNGSSYSVSLSGQAITVSYGRNFQEKNLLELKSGRRVLIEGNYFENNWGAGRQTSAEQAGSAMLLTPRGWQTGGGQKASLSNACATSQCNSGVSDVTVRNNIFRHVAACIDASGFDDSSLGLVTTNIAIENNECSDVNRYVFYESYNSSTRAGNLFGVLSGVGNVLFNHNTMLGQYVQWMVYSYLYNADLHIKNNILQAGDYLMKSETVNPDHSELGPPFRTRCVDGNWGSCVPGSLIRNSAMGGGRADGQTYSFNKNAIIAPFQNFDAGDATGYNGDLSRWGSGYYGGDYFIPNQYWITKSLQGGGSSANVYGWCGALKFADCSASNYRLQSNSPVRAGAPTSGTASEGSVAGNTGRGDDGWAVGVKWHSNDAGRMILDQFAVNVIRASGTALNLEYAVPPATGGACSASYATNAALSSPSTGSHTGSGRFQKDVLTVSAGSTYYYKVTCGNRSTAGVYTAN